MKIPQIIHAELRRLVSTPMLLLALVALLCVPILYGGLYLWANQDPYGQLARIPAAIVVDDTGASVNGAERSYGDEVAQELLASNTFDWRRVGSAEAEGGLASGRFDFVIVIPADFSAAIASISSSDPKKAEIQLRTDDANNYLASTIGSQAVERIQADIVAKVIDEAGLTLLADLQTIRVKISDAANGAQELVDGLGTARSGAEQLAAGTASLATGTAELRDGAAQLSGGAGELSAGAARVAGGTAELDRIADELGAASAGAVAQLPTARNDIAQALTAAGVDPGETARILTALDPVGELLDAANSRVQGAVGRIDELNAGAQEVAAGAAQLAEGSARLAEGTATAAAGAAELNDGAARLGPGTAELLDGASQLQTGLADGVSQIPESDEDTRSAQASTLSDPVSVSTSDLAQAQNYGAGLAPFFAALAGWIGIYSLFLIVKPISRRAVTALHAPVRVTLAGWLTPAMFGAVQMVGLFAVLAFALRFSFANPLPTLGLLIAATATYAAIVLALNVWFGEVGEFLGLVLMVVQLVSAGGTFPWQTLPGPLAAAHQVLPMGYVVDGMRQLMYGGSLPRVWLDLGVLAMWLIAGLVLSAVGVARITRRRTLADLQPSIFG
ncbi:YhgE/Pip domain-containing protein [Microbacterium sp. dk485]|uniref:YhgE/Pip family protein n=1 Tax=Microbacterium TaxID=33882 RepID=UPI0010739BC4|nr:MULTISPECIES: YhgE/Pip domain-containing protein [Microbacterium]TFV84633.1 YhgE/Pip domain-containing protein [Microbacterium sp. dk485]TXK14585.1 YhgE/Pip domain-containing protein [Microbacterium wangchenii]